MPDSRQQSLERLLDEVDALELLDPDQTEHPSEEEKWLFAEGRLSPFMKEPFQAHVDRCELCTGRLIEIFEQIEAEPSKAQEAEAEAEAEVIPFRKPRRWAMPLAMAATWILAVPAGSWLTSQFLSPPAPAGVQAVSTPKASDQEPLMPRENPAASNGWEKVFDSLNSLEERFSTLDTQWGDIDQKALVAEILKGLGGADTRAGGTTPARVDVEIESAEVARSLLAAFSTDEVRSAVATLVANEIGNEVSSVLVALDRTSTELAALRRAATASNQQKAKDSNSNQYSGPEYFEGE